MHTSYLVSNKLLFQFVKVMSVDDWDEWDDTWDCSIRGLVSSRDPLIQFKLLHQITHQPDWLLFILVQQNVGVVHSPFLALCTSIIGERDRIAIYLCKKYRCSDRGFLENLCLTTCRPAAAVMARLGETMLCYIALPCGH